MPIYEYKCEKGHVVEVVQSMADDPLTKCEECGAPAQRVLYAPAVHFKGKGFYNTDYGTKKRQREKAASKSDSSSGSSSTSESKKSDSGSKSSSESKPKADSGPSGKPAKKD